MPTIRYEFYSPVEVFRVLEVIPGYLTLRVVFSKPALLDSELLNPLNYTITVVDPTTAFDFETISVTPEPGEANPLYVDLEMTDCTHGKDYVFAAIPGKIQSYLNEYLLGAGCEKEFVGVSELPEAIFVEALSSTSVRVTFSKIMSQNVDITNPSHYVFTGGLSVLSVEQETQNSVILTTTEQTASSFYDLTVT